MYTKLAPSLLISLLLLTKLFAQKENNTWHFGYSAGIDFNQSPPQPLTTSPNNSFEGCATISDPTTGQLLFYCNGVQVWDRNHAPMFNGNNLHGHLSSTQACAILPRPGSSRFYYIVTSDSEGNSNGFKYSEVDMYINGGLGGITANKNVFLQGPGLEKIALSCHANQTDYWIVLHELGNNVFNAFQVSSLGINLTPVSSSVGAVLGPIVTDTGGQMVISPNADKIGLANNTAGIPQVFDFNSSTGIISNPVTLPSASNEYGSAFSPDGSKFYLSSYGIPPQQVVQFDLNVGTPAAIAASKVIVDSTVNFGTNGSMYLGPDGHIYISRVSLSFLDVITNPNAAGLACGYTQMGFPLNSGQASGGLNNLPSCYATVILDADLRTISAELNANQEVMVNWEAIEKTSEGKYTVERSRDGAYFQKIGQVPFPGNTPEVAQLQFLDVAPGSGSNFYRVKATDPNGAVTLSRVVEIYFSKDNFPQLRLYPNPAQEQVGLALDLPYGPHPSWQIAIFDAAGQRVLQQNWESLGAGVNRYVLQLSGLAPGIYALKVTSGKQQIQTRMSIIR